MTFLRMAHTVPRVLLRVCSATLTTTRNAGQAITRLAVVPSASS